MRDRRLFPGYDTGVISGAILFITEDFGLSPFMQGAGVTERETATAAR